MNSGIRIVSPLQRHSFDTVWYDNATEGHFWFRWRLRAFLTMLRDLGMDLQAPLRVLDVGAGQGTLRDQIERETAWTVDCVDLDRQALEAANGGRGQKLYYDVNDKVSDLVGSYDAVIVFDVIEHIVEPTKFLDACLMHAKPGGRMFVNVPALQSMHSAYDRVIGHLRRYSTRSLRAEICSLAIDVEECRYWGLSMLPLLMARKFLDLWPRDQATTVRLGFQPPNRWFNRLMTVVGAVESTCLRKPLAGTSVMLAARRTR